MITLVVDDAEDEGERADVVLGRRVPGLSRRIARAIALGGKLRIGGRSAPPSTRVKRGDRLELLVEREPARVPARVLATTDAFVYVDKPCGMHTHALRPDDTETLADRVALVHPECATASPDPREGGAIHRLDFETSGVVAFARSRSAWARGRAAIERAHKVYLALCHADGWPPAAGTPAQDEPPPLGPELPPPQPGTAVRLEAPIGRGPGSDRVRVVDEGGQHATTTVWPLGPIREGRLLCALTLRGGRRHQLRAHLAWAKMPICGDARYGSDITGEPLRLHAYLLDLGIDGEAPAVAPPGDSAWLASMVSSR